MKTNYNSSDKIQNLINALVGWVSANSKQGLRNLPSTKRVMPETVMRIRQLRGILEARAAK